MASNGHDCGSDVETRRGSDRLTGCKNRDIIKVGVKKKKRSKGNFDKNDSFLLDLDNCREVIEEVQFYLYYFKTGKLKMVSKKIFNLAKGVFRSVKNSRIKFVGNVKKEFDINKFLSSFKAEGNNFITYMSKIYSYITNCVDKIEQIKKFNYKEFCLDIVSFFLSIYQQFEQNSLCNIASILFDFYRLVSRNYLMKAEGFDTFFMSAASLFMPPKLYEVFRRMQTFSNVKILDDFKIFQDILTCTFDFIKGCIDVIPIDDKCKLFLSTSLEKLFCFKDYFIMKEIRDLVQVFKSDNRITADLTFQNRVNCVDKKIQEDVFVLEWARKSNVARLLLEEFSHIKRVVDSYLATSRVEPCCFIFEGPAGSGKSLMLNNLSTILKRSKYVHSTKSFMDGKNFYDMYCNEDVYIEDDIGQQGVSQWRTMINFVSSVKCPLECAEIKNKGVKFFSSKIMLLSTNHFMTLPPLLKSDCISEIEALHRRGYVFDFSSMRIDVDGYYKGKLNFKIYDVMRKVWLTDFPETVNKYLKQHNIKFSSTFSIEEPSLENNLRLYSWVKDIVLLCEKSKINTATNFDISRFTDEINAFSIFNAETKAYKFEYQGVNIGHFIPTFMEFDDSFFNANEIWINGCQVIITGIEKYFNSPSLDFFLWLTWKFNSLLFVTVQDPDLTSDMFIANLVCLIMNFLIIFLLYKLVKGLIKVVTPKAKDKGKFIAESTDLHPSIYAIQKQLFEVDLISQAGKLQAHGLCSGHCVLVTSHMVLGDTGFLTLYKNRTVNHRLLDNKKFKVVFRDDKADVAILMIDEFFPTPFKNLSKHFKEMGDKTSPKLWFVNSQGAVQLESRIINKTIIDKYHLTYENGQTFTGDIDKNNLLYDIRGDGQCGSLIVSPFKGVVGVHVAGSAINGIGVASFFGKELLNKIKGILEKDDKFMIDVEISDKDQHDFSGIKLSVDFAASTPKVTNFRRSPLYGLFEPEREPVDLSIFGPHTVKDVAKKSFKPVKDITLEEADFIETCLHQIIEDFTDITEKEVVLGGVGLSRLNKDSCNGFCKLKEKSEYVDYENGQYTDLLKTERLNFIEDCINGKINLQDIAWVETLKDELRSIEKNRVPRSFRYCNVVLQVLNKEVFGNFVRNMMRNRWFNGVMIGINPYKDWDQLYNKIVQDSVNGGFFDGDFKNWDGGMLPQIQEIVMKVLGDHYVGKLPKCVFNSLLQCLVGCLVIVNDDVYLTNHSMPSGYFLTALINCIVNFCYSTLWYYRTIKNQRNIDLSFRSPTVGDFFKTLFPATYGDDLLSVVKKEPHLFNAISFAKFCDEIGLGFTTASKTAIIDEFSSFDNLTFLKRSFAFDPRIGRVMCPLDLRTVRSSIMYYDSQKDLLTVMYDKLHAFQREIYLHKNLYEIYMQRLIDFCEKKKIHFIPLPENYLKYLYINESDTLYETNYK